MQYYLCREDMDMFDKDTSPIFKDSWPARVLGAILRIYVGWNFLQPAIEKISGPAAVNWVGAKAGTAISGFLHGALQKTGGLHPDVQWLYADFIKSVALPNAKLLSYLVSWGELAVGVGLIAGCFTTAALLAGAFLNFNYLFAGTVSINPLLVLLEVILLWLGPAAYFLGVDRLIGRRREKKPGPRGKISLV